MEPPKINLLHSDKAGSRRGRRFSLWKGSLIGLVALILIVPTLFSVMSLRLIRAATNLNPDQENVKKLSLVEQVRYLVGNDERALDGESEDRINILAMGEGGEGHDGPHLTDTMLFVTIQPSTKKVGILSLPRDLWVTLPDRGKGKINAANAYAEKENARSGGAYAAKVVSELLDQPVHYYVRVDFSAFKTLIDDVGGVTVNVDRSFTDFAYPTDDELYKKVSFERGWQTMSGDTALEYVRSRHGNNGEGSDFMRSRRQQKVILALKEKVVSFDTLLNPSRIASILETLEHHVITDMGLWEIVKLAKLMRDVDGDDLSRFVLDDNPEGPLYASTVPLPDGDAYVLLPRRGDWSEIRQIARNIVTYNALPDATEKAPATIEVRNGTIRPGLAAKTRERLERIGFEVETIGNAKRQDYEKTVIYDMTNGSDPERLSTLKNFLNAEIALTLPGYLTSDVTPSGLSLSNGDIPEKPETHVDFMVILGNNHLSD